MKKAHGDNVYAHGLMFLSLHYFMLSIKTINSCATTIAPDLIFMNNKHVVTHKRLPVTNLSLLVLICIRSAFQWIDTVLCFYIKCATQDGIKREIIKVFNIKRHLISYPWTTWFLYLKKKAFFMLVAQRIVQDNVLYMFFFFRQTMMDIYSDHKKDSQNISPIKSWEKYENWHHFI